jgi:hypothetical protein
MPSKRESRGQQDARPRSAWIKEQQRVKDDAIKEYQVNMMVTFVIDD